MANVRKKMIIGISFLIMQGVCGMESGEQDLQGVLGHYMSPETLGTLSSTVSAGWSAVSTGFARATTTAINAYSDEAAFAKLGFPPTNDVNNAELAKFKGVRDRHHQAILANEIADEQFNLDDRFLNRRFEFLKRAISAMPARVDGVELAGFCLEHYEKVMNSFMISRMVTFIHSKQESSEQVVQKLSSLADVTDSALLRSVLQGSGINKRNSIVEEEHVEKKEEIAEDQQ